MCGIAGILNYHTKVDRSHIEAMTEALFHRGPDGSGIWMGEQIALGHRRLAIIDLATGQQPLSNEDETVWVTFNGEIYNYLELREQLISFGHHFKTRSDTEVIVHAYEQWGDRCVEKFRGMFAFGIVDLKAERIFLARDQFGIKPLYYLNNYNCFAFASEIQALRQLKQIELDLDLKAIDQYLALQYIPAPYTAFEQLKKLPPAHRLSITFDGKISEVEEYWQLDFKPDYSKSEADWLEELDFILRESVKTHLVTDVPFGAFLSGGVDSSAIVAYMSQILKQPIKTFSIGFEEDKFSELQYAEIAAKRWQTEHHTEIVKAESLEEMLPKLVKHYGEPFGDNSAIPMYCVAQMARRQVTMVLSGDGADECFAGYNTYRSWMGWLRGEEKPRWKQWLYPVASFLEPDRYPPPTPTLDGWFRYITRISKNFRSQLWNEEHKNIIQNKIEVLERERAKIESYDWAQKAQYLDIKTYLPFSILTKVDIASMMNSLEVRTPWVDVKVYEFAAQIPERLNIAKNDRGDWEGKLLLKKLLSRYYSPEYLHRTKMGFCTPIPKWLSSGGSSRKYLKARLLGKESRLHEFFQPKAIQKLVDYNEIAPLWLLLFLDEWLSQNT